MYRIVIEDPLHPNDPLRSGPYADLESACREVAETVEEFMSLLHSEEDTVDSLLARYAQQGWRPTIEADGQGEAARGPDKLIRERAVAWVHGDAAEKWINPEV